MSHSKSTVLDKKINKYVEVWGYTCELCEKFLRSADNVLKHDKVHNSKPLMIYEQKRVLQTTLKKKVRK